MTLTAKQEKFARLVALEGLSLSEAYRQAGYSTDNCSLMTVHNNAYMLKNTSEVAASIQKLTASLETEDRNLRKIAVDTLLAVVEAVTEGLPRSADKIAAADKLAKIAGAYREPEQARPQQTVTQVTVILNHGTLAPRLPGYPGEVEVLDPHGAPMHPGVEVQGGAVPDEESA